MNTVLWKVVEESEARRQGGSKADRFYTVYYFIMNICDKVLG